MAFIQLGQRQHQSAKYQGYHLKKLRSQQDGRMKKRFGNFMISQFKRTFQTIYLNEICFLIYVYMELFIWETYLLLIILKTILIRLEKNPQLLIISSLHSLHLYERTGN